MELASQRVVGLASSLIVLWDDYDLETTWRDFTDGGMFTNHDPVRGRTLYGAEVMVDPELQGAAQGRRPTAPGARSRSASACFGLAQAPSCAVTTGSRAANPPRRTSPAWWQAGKRDPTLSLQLKQGFHVPAVAQGYVRHDPESRGHAAVIVWINRLVARPEGYRSGAAPTVRGSAQTGRRRRIKAR